MMQVYFFDDYLLTDKNPSFFARVTLSLSTFLITKVGSTNFYL